MHDGDPEVGKEDKVGQPIRIFSRKIPNRSIKSYFSYKKTFFYISVLRWQRPTLVVALYRTAVSYSMVTVFCPNLGCSKSDVYHKTSL